MKTTLTILFFCTAFACGAWAQGAAYDRPTVNFLLLKHGDNFDASSAQALAQVLKEDKFYSNNLDVKELQMPQLKRDGLTTTTWQPILAELTRQNVAKKEVVAWYCRQSNGLMSMALIHERGEFNATDDAYHLATTTKRGTDELKDFGSKLIAKTYVVVLSFSGMSYAALGSTDTHSWSSTVRAFVYKLHYNAAVENQIYDTWIDEGDSPQQVANKQRRFNQLEFDMDYVTQVSTGVTATALITGRALPDENALVTLARTAALRVKSKDELLADMYRKGYSNAMNALEKQVPEFKVLAGVSSLRPIRAKIGKKEGLRTDQRYFVTEYEEVANGKIKANRKAVVRVGSKVVDNRRATTGNSGESRFYQIAGGRVDKGMTLEQKNEMGMSIALGYGFPLQNSAQAGVQLRLEQLTNKLWSFGIPALYVYGEGEIDAKFRWGLGLGKGCHFGRNFSLSPYVGLGCEYTDIGGTSDETYYGKLGANLTLNIYYPLQLVGGGYYTSSSSGASGFVGVRICF